MEQLKQILQHKMDGVVIREIARRIGISRNSVRKYSAALDQTEVSSAIELAHQAYHNDTLALDTECLRQLTIYFSKTGSELSKTGVTSQLLWKEYLGIHPDGYSDSRYCYHLEQYFKNRDLAMHLEYEPADMIMVDFAGKKLQYTDPSTGACIECDVFISIQPFSGLVGSPYFACQPHSVLSSSDQ